LKSLASLLVGHLPPASSLLTPRQGFQYPHHARSVYLIGAFAAILLASPAVMADPDTPPPKPPAEPAGEKGATGGGGAPASEGATPAQRERARQIARAQDDLDPMGGPPTVKKPADGKDLISRFHPVLVHLPLAWLVLLLIVDLGTFLLRITDWRRAGPLILFATILSAIPAAITGFLRADYVSGFFKQQLVGLHQNLMLSVVGICVLALLLRVRVRNNLEGGVRTIYLVMVAAAVVLAFIGGHLGAKMVFGPNYLPF